MTDTSKLKAAIDAANDAFANVVTEVNNILDTVDTLDAELATEKSKTLPDMSDIIQALSRINEQAKSGSASDTAPADAPLPDYSGEGMAQRVLDTGGVLPPSPTPYLVGDDGPEIITPIPTPITDALNAQENAEAVADSARPQ